MIKTAPAVLAMLAALAIVPLAAHAGANVHVAAQVRAGGLSPMSITEGKMVYSADGQRLAPIYRVNDDGSVQFIMDGRLITVPSTVLTEVGGKLTSSQNKGDLLH